MHHPSGLASATPLAPHATTGGGAEIYPQAIHCTLASVNLTALSRVRPCSEPFASKLTVPCVAGYSVGEVTR